MTVFAQINRQVAISFERYLSVGVRLLSAHFIPNRNDFYRQFGQLGESRARSFAEERYRSERIAGPHRAKRQRQRDGQNSCVPRGRLVIDHELSGILKDGSGSRSLRCAGDRAGSVVAKNSPCYELLLVRAQIELRYSRGIRPAVQSIDRTHFGGSSNAARLVGIEERRGIHDCALHGRLGAGFLDPTLDRSVGPAKGPAKNAPCAARSC